MTRNTILKSIGVCILFGSIIVGFITDKIHSRDSLLLLTNTTLINKIELSIITSPTFTGKRNFTITDSKTLYDLNKSFQQQLKPLNVTPAKLNSVFAILTVYKGPRQTEIDVLNSTYTGWLMKIGSGTFRDSVLIDFLKIYLR